MPEGGCYYCGNTMINTPYASSQKYLGFANFQKYDIAGFHKLFHIFAIYSFAKFCKVLQLDFGKDSQVPKSWFFTRFCNGYFADGQ